MPHPEAQLHTQAQLLLSIPVWWEWSPSLVSTCCPHSPLFKACIVCIHLFLAVLGLCCHMDSSQLQWAGLLPRCSDGLSMPWVLSFQSSVSSERGCSLGAVPASQCRGSSRFGAQSPGCAVAVDAACGLSCDAERGILLDQGSNCERCDGRQTLVHWTTREVQPLLNCSALYFPILVGLALCG